MSSAALLTGVAWSALAALARETADAPAPAPTPAPVSVHAPLETAQSVPSRGPSDAPFGPDDLLWMEVQAGGLPLTESMNLYASRLGVYAPLGELSRLLDLAIAVYPDQRRAEGWALSPDRRVTVDLAALTARADGRDIRIQPGQAVFHDGDLYVRLDLLEQLLPLTARADTRSLLFSLTFNEAFPAQLRLERDQRRAALAQAGAAPAVREREVDLPYRMFTPPAFDIGLGAQAAGSPEHRTRRFEVRAAGDLFHGGLEAYAGSDDRGRLRDVRLTLSRKDADGAALGPWGEGGWGGVRAAIGDVDAPAMAIGAAGYSGRGVFYSTAPLDSYDLATPLDLRGELAAGEEVELYVNEVLHGSQGAPVQGRYEFLNVPLTYGVNTLRLVFYGPHGETREQVRRVNFGAGQVEAGRFVVRFGAVQQGRTLIEPGGVVRNAETGEGRVIATLDYGAAPGLTVSAGFAHYTPRNEEARALGSMGFRLSMGGAAVRADYAMDDRDGRGMTLGLAARPLGFGLVMSHSEYEGGFADETRRTGLADNLVMTRASDIRVDGGFAGPGRLNIPFAVTVRRIDFADDSRLLSAELRASAPVGPWYLSNSLALEDERRGATRSRRLVGAADLARIASVRTQMRAGVTYEITPDAAVESAYAQADIRLADESVLRLGAVRTLEDRETLVHAAYIRRVGDFDLGLNAAYETHSREWRVGLQLNFSLGHDPLSGQYRRQRPGSAAGGAVAVNAWIDENGDGVRQTHEPAATGVGVYTSAGDQATDARGHAYSGDLGDGARAHVRIDENSLPDAYLAPATESAVVFTPRPGRTAVIDYPLQSVGEVEFVAALERPTGPARPLAALTVRLVHATSSEVFTARSDHAGVVYFDRVPPGEYGVQLDPEQEAVAGLTLAAPARVTVSAQGGFVRGGPVLVRLISEAPQRPASEAPR